MTNVSVFLVESADIDPDAVALRCGDVSTAYVQLANDVARFAEYLIDGGIQPGDRIGVMLPNGPGFVVVFYGALHAGAVVVPMCPSQHARALEYLLTITDSRALFFSSRRSVATTVAAVTAGAQPIGVGKHSIVRLIAGFAGHAHPVGRAVDDTAVILHTTAAAGASRSAELTHGNLIADQTALARGLLNLEPDDVVMSCLPLWEACGMTCALMATMAAGATLVLPPKFYPGEALELIAAQRVTVFEGNPKMYAAMLEVADRYELDFGSLRVCISAGAPLPVDVLHRFEDRFGCVVMDRWGAAETRRRCT